MNELDRIAFLSGVKQYVENDPEIMPFLLNALTQGLSAALSSVKERAADMEVVAAILLNKRYKNRDQLIKSKLEKWKGKCSLNWEDYLGESNE